MTAVMWWPPGVVAVGLVDGVRVKACSAHGGQDGFCMSSEPATAAGSPS